MKTVIYFFLINSLLFSFNAFSQNDTIKKETTWSMFKEDGALIAGGLKYAYTQPLKWEKDDWLTFGGIALGAAVMYIYDEETSEYFVNQNDNAPQMLKEIGWYYGSPQNFFMIASGIYGYGLFTKNEAFRHTGVLIISAAAATGILQTIGKNAIGRARPSQGVGSREYKFMSKESGYHSFPSGHSILSFTASHAIAKQFDNIWVKAGIYGVGLIAPVSRLWAGAHWLTDVTLGMVLSIVVVDSVENFLLQKKKELKEKQINWSINFKGQGIGITGTF